MLLPLIPAETDVLSSLIQNQSLVPKILATNSGDLLFMG